MKIGIVILNYLAYQVTMETVGAFMKQDTDGNEIRIIIVDNCSPNESYAKLCDAYAESPVVDVLVTEKNLGFAKGNNFGCRKLLDEMKPDFVIISNDDILLPQPGLYRWITECYEKYGFAVLGPDVYSVNGKFHQSPYAPLTQDPKECRKIIAELKMMYLRCRIKKLLHCAAKFGVARWENTFYQDVRDDMTLHGSFQVFSSAYFRYYDLPYDPRTFLYREEDILRLRCDQKNLRCVYDPGYRIEHLQAVSTNMVNPDHNMREIARIRNMLNATKVYLEILNESK